MAKNLGKIKLTTAEYLKDAPHGTLSVQISYPLAFRMWLAFKLLKVACWLTGIEYNEEIKDA